jgi:NAD(P)-dependent dehydrogenase (short-subunit alcohol dehydrogenase family)
MGDLSGKVAIVTGASRGIGRGASIAFAEAGADVVVAARSVDKLADLVAEIEAAGGRALAVACDVRDRGDIEACVNAAIRQFGRLDVLYNNAQTVEYLYLKDSSDETMLDVIMSGPIATFRFMKAAYPHLKAARGVVINTGSSSRYLPSGARYGPYNSAKAGIEALTRTAADEWAEDGIRVFMLNPEAESTMTLNWKAREPEKYAAAVAGKPNNRMGHPVEDIGRPLVKLILDADAYNGKTLGIDSSGVRDTIETIWFEEVRLG